MRLIQPNVTEIKQEPGLEGIYKQIELAGRNCYQSGHRIKEGSAKLFTEMMLNNGHYAMLEHGTVYLSVPEINQSGGDVVWTKYGKNEYSEVRFDKGEVHITTNMRVLAENNWMHDLEHLCEPTEFHAKRRAFEFTTQIAITREMNRHRKNSMAEESTHYINYKKKGIAVSIPEFIKDYRGDDWDDLKIANSEQYINEFNENLNFHDLCKMIGHNDDNHFSVIDYWLFANMAAEYSYLNMVRLGAKPKQARTVLSLDTKSTLIHTAFEHDWRHFISLRADRHAHPDVQVLARFVVDFLDKE